MKWTENTNSLIFTGTPKSIEEIKALLSKLGDESAVVDKTIANGIAAVKTSLDAREVVKKIRELYQSGKIMLFYAIKFVPVDEWCASELEEMKKVVDKLKEKILPDEKWAMEVEKRRWTKMHRIDVIKELAKDIKQKVDLENPDKILRIDIIGKHAAISLIKPDEIFSTRK